MINVTGFLLGYYAMHNQWIQLAWFLLMSSAFFLSGGYPGFSQSLRRDRWLAAFAGLVFLLLVRSSIIDSFGVSVSGLWLGWLKAGLLVGAMMMIWQAGTVARVARILGLPLAVTATATAIGSVIIFYVLDPNAVLGSRLNNWFVYGGWNSVCTGMTFGFAATWAVFGWIKAAVPRERTFWFVMAVILLWATLMTLSRGALLGLVAGQVAIFCARGWRISRRPLILFVSCILAFQFSAPLISRLDVQKVSQRLGVTKETATQQMIVSGDIADNPAARFIKRGDNGRFIIYGAALGSMTTWQDWFFGKGLWASNDSWSCSLYWNPEHMHSVFVDALVRGGVPTFVLFIALLGWGLYRAWVLARHGEELWLMLACYGISGLVFDGDSAFSLLSIPRFETLILWVPLVIASARYTLRDYPGGGLDLGQSKTLS